jgi:hypothetical protein
MICMICRILLEIRPLVTQPLQPQHPIQYIADYVVTRPPRFGNGCQWFSKSALELRMSRGPGGRARRRELDVSVHGRQNDECRSGKYHLAIANRCMAERGESIYIQYVLPYSDQQQFISKLAFWLFLPPASHNNNNNTPHGKKGRSRHSHSHHVSHSVVA